MYKALIVDDESIIRNGIAKVIPWESLQIDEIFVSGNGFDALKIIEREKPHILITDINMTEMSGLEMIESTQSMHPGIKIIVITGYDLFEYAQKCIKMKVDDFFLKPVGEDDLANAIEKLISQLEYERQELLLRRTQGAVEQLRLEKDLRALVHGRLPGNDLPEFPIQYIPEDTAVQIAAIALNPMIENKEFQLLSLKNICMDFIDCRGLGITFQDDDGRVLLIIFELGNPEASAETVTQLGYILRDEFDEKPEIVLGKSVPSLKNLRESYTEAVSLLSDENMNGIVKRVKEIINESLADSISVLSISSQLYISPNYLSRLFKKVTGEGCNEYIVRKRIENAKNLLKTTNYPSGKIAGLVGYQDINYFSVAFKKHTGMSPTKYRESHK